ncbi:hypothetical protein [Paenibacillus eucommiae]|uniref:Copper amine oxidase-like N-terminal domain-containing protein n=1 Tax=Paenibacillus eucommiae TaxID=1355755 RepID=A0ABS4J1N6_9BACL|nr:hypothetical protein [Paenibacillus eucommiae]MBP1993758.1 hypothetical protein [Paenibacillus eucommiae]
MKKFIIGFMCGAAIATTTTVWAADSIQAYLFPSKVEFRHGEMITPVDVSGDNAVINYNNKAYIPLRTFAEAIGAKVSFKEAAASNGNKNQIILMTGQAFENGPLTLSDPDNNVNIGDLYVVREPNGNNSLTSGTIRINKVLKDKEIEIHAFDAKGELIGKTDFVYIQDSESKPPRPGETRLFSTSLTFNGNRKMDSCVIKIRDQLKAIESKETDVHLLGSGGIAALYPPGGFDGYLPAGQVAPFIVFFQNTIDHEIELKPFEMNIKVTRIDKNNEFVELVYEKKLPTIEGPLQSLSFYHFTVPWNPVDREGRPLSKGRYQITLERPDTFRYTLDGGSIITEPLITNTRTPTAFNVELQ